MATQYYCKNLRRRALIRRDTRGGHGNPILNGIDYLEVSADQKTLYVYFIHNLPGQANGVPDSPVLAASNVVIQGGVRIKLIHTLTVAAAGNLLKVKVDAPGDYSIYTIRLRSSSTATAQPAGFDPQLSEVQFSFKVDCPNDFDCKPEDECPPEEPGPEPPIDYLAKDYASFRRLMLDRLSVVIPDWKDRSAADLGVALVETIAYTADHLSYYQDAVATEAYLGTARRRVSVHRHARILDYYMHDGCNSRVWAHVAVTGANVHLEKGTQLLTKVPGFKAPVNQGSLEYDRIMSQSPAAFETMHDALLHQSHNKIRLYTWGDEECCLPKGATRATLLDDKDNRLLLRPGDVLIFEEVAGVNANEQPDPSHRHAVRLTSVVPATDPLTEKAIVEVQWLEKDALPFPLCISTSEVQDISIARGNVVLASQGRRVGTPKDREIITVPEREGQRPAPQEPEVTHIQSYDHDDALTKPATGMLEQDPRKALPEVVLTYDGVDWTPVRDLLNSSTSSTVFAVETEDDRVSYLRFGDGIMGRKPAAGTEFKANYRVGNGRSGNVGADAIYHIVTNKPTISGVRNPMSARGGEDPEPIERVRIHAPQAFRTQERAVTENDYTQVAQRHPEVQKAVATRRWTGSWHTMFITVDRKEGRAVDAGFEEKLRLFLEKYRLAGHDVEIEPPIFVPLDIEMRVCVLQGYLRGQVEEALLEKFSSQLLSNGSLGFWHPDNFTFGQPVYLSKMVAAAMEVPGVMWVEVVKFQPWGKPDLGELKDSRIVMDRLEIARLDNDPNAPENGKMELLMEGGK
jgi:hypothetical protein